MPATRKLFLVLLMPGALACDGAPTTPFDGAPQAATGSGARFLEATATGPTAQGQLFVTARLTGLGSMSTTPITASADGSVEWACRTSAGAYDLYPAPAAVSGPVERSFTPSGRSGQITQTIVVPSPTSPILCLMPGHQLVPLSASFTGVMVSQAEAGVREVPGTYAATFATISPETAAEIAGVSLPDATAVIDGDFVPYSVSLQNPGSTLPLTGVQAWVRQGDTYRAGGFALVNCGEEPVGDLPNGSCTFDYSFRARTDAGASGSGTLVAGAAILELYLFTGTDFRSLDGIQLPITLVD